MSEDPTPEPARGTGTTTEISSTAVSDPQPTKKKKGGCLRWFLIVIGVLLAVVVIGVAALVITKPWYTPPTVVEPGPGGRVVTDDGLMGHYYPAPGGTRGPAVLVLGGSEGGLGTGARAQAEGLRDAGFSVLGISYWGGPGQPQSMEQLPLETFSKALDWLHRQPEVDPQRVGVVGTSKGGEAVMLMAVRRPDIKAVVGNVPSSVAWAGINLAEIWKMPSIGGTWSEGGREIPYLPYGRNTGKTLDSYVNGLDAMPPDHPSIIPIERTKAPILAVCGEQDALWPSCRMSRALQQRAAERGGPPVTILAYPDAGHAAGGRPVAKDNPAYQNLAAVGGTVEGNATAREDSWPKIIDHLKKNLGAAA